MAASEIDETGVKRLSLIWGSFCVPSQLQSLQLLLLLSRWQPHLLSLLFIHNLSDRPLSLLIEILQRFSVVNFGRIYFWITLENCGPNTLLGFLQVKGNKLFASALFNLPHGVSCIDFLN